MAVEAVGIDAETAKALGIGFAPRGIMAGLVAVLIRLEDGTLAGYIGITEAKLPKSFHLVLLIPAQAAHHNEMMSARVRRPTTQIPHPPRSNPHSARGNRRAFPQRGFLPWRLSDAGPRHVQHRLSSGRHPKPFTIAAVTP